MKSHKNVFLSSRGLFLVLVCFLQFGLNAQSLDPIPLDDAWMTRIKQLAPAETKPVKKKKTALIFSLHTGFDHWVTPHTEAVIRIIGEKSGEFEISTSKDITMFWPENLAKFDVVVLNNNCSHTSNRDLFWDKLGENSDLSPEDRKVEAKKLEQNLLDYVNDGGGLVIMHGAVTMLNNSDAFSKMVGASFDYHPKQQTVMVKLVDPKHPLVSSFGGKEFSHYDEPYFFKNAYSDLNFKPLLYMEASQLEGLREGPKDNRNYISWIKRHGRGKVFYSSISHNAQSFEQAPILAFLLNGMRYASGNLDCDDSPLGLGKQSSK